MKEAMKDATKETMKIGLMLECPKHAARNAHALAACRSTGDARY
jgi:hypothetical protein